MSCAKTAEPIEIPFDMWTLIGPKQPCIRRVMLSIGWLGSRVVSVLDSGAEGPGSNRSRDAVG